MELRMVKILLIPDKEQRQAFYDSAYYSDKMYNIALQWNIDYYETDDKFYSYFDMTRMLTDFKKECPEFATVDIVVLRDAVKSLRTALDRMKIGSGFPKFRKFGRKLSFGIQAQTLTVQSNRVRIPKIGWVKCKHCHWLTRGKTDEELSNIKYHNPHIKFDGKYWFLSFGVEVQTTRDTLSDEVIGIDVGIKNHIYTSNGISEPNINHTRTIEILERRKKILQRKISRKYLKNKQGDKFVKTKNIKRAERKLRLIYRRLTNIRENNLHRMCNRVISCLPKRIMLEELNVTAMMKNKHLSRAIQEQLFYRTRLLLTEKARNCFIEVGLVDRYYPSSKKCSRCGYINKHLKLSDRIFICPNCGLKIDRDYNASINIRDCKEYALVTY